MSSTPCVVKSAPWTRARILAREVAFGHEDDIAVLLAPEGERRVRLELRAFVDDGSDLLRRPSSCSIGRTVAKSMNTTSP